MQAPNEVFTTYARTLIRIKARQLRRRPSFRDAELADIEQDLALYLLSQAEHFDPTRGAVNTFIDRVVESGAAILARARKREKRLPDTSVAVTSIADVVDQPDGPPAPLAALVSNEDLQRRTGVYSLTDAELFELIDDVRVAFSSLPPDLQQLCSALVDHNHTITKRTLSLSRRAFDVALNQLRRHFAQAGLKKN